MSSDECLFFIAAVSDEQCALCVFEQTACSVLEMNQKNYVCRLGIYELDLVWLSDNKMNTLTTRTRERVGQTFRLRLLDRPFNVAMKGGSCRVPASVSVVPPPEMPPAASAR
mmetsp:Transcript_46142/g.114787  ORF Transcript_46142/g.114787 Transcript_46142/m.114787 type:complete len:112 (+) Transcript_46142:5471-5806(+)